MCDASARATRAAVDLQSWRLPRFQSCRVPNQSAFKAELLPWKKLVIKERVVRYDSAMTTPPDGLPHRIASLVLTEFLQTQKSLFKFFGRCIVAIVMKTLSDPESISVGAVRICKLLQLEYCLGPTIPKVLTMTMNIGGLARKFRSWSINNLFKSVF